MFERRIGAHRLQQASSVLDEQLRFLNRLRGGAKIENQAHSGDYGALDALVAEYADFLDKVNIVFG